MATKIETAQPFATGFLHLTCSDDYTEGAYNMSRDAAVTFTIEQDGNGNAVRVWLENLVSGRREAVEIEEHEPFVHYLLDMALEVGEDHGRPWRQPNSSVH